MSTQASAGRAKLIQVQQLAPEPAGLWNAGPTEYHEAPVPIAHKCHTSAALSPAYSGVG